MNLFQAMVLAINTSILAVLFAFSAWLYTSSRAEVLTEMQASLSRAAKVTDALAALKTRELGVLAQSMAVSPMLRGAVATNDGATIRDVLETLARKNTVAAVQLYSGGKLRHGFGGGAGFKGRAPAGEQELEVWQAPDRALLDSWTAVTGMHYALTGAKLGVDNLPREDGRLATHRPPRGEAAAVDGEKGRYYAQESPLADGDFQVVIFAERAPYWRSFEARRNSLAVLGAALFFVGLLLSALFARLIEKSAAQRPAGDVAQFQRLLDEIEAVRSARRGRAS